MNFHSFSRFVGSALLLATIAFGRTDGTPDPAAAKSQKSPAPPVYSYEVVHAWPHDPRAFTQGLVFRNGELLESTGLFGESTVREVELETGNVIRKITVPGEYFGEGLAVIGSRAFQVTWRNHRGFVYDATSFEWQREFTYEGEGWGLTTDGNLLILSDGTHRIRFLDPDTFRVVRTIDVLAAGKPVDNLNELEWVKGEIFANIWQTDRVARIDPTSGEVRSFVDFSSLLPDAERGPETDVLNGIAYDAVKDRLFVTGKRWPKLYEVRLIPPATNPR